MPTYLNRCTCGTEWHQWQSIKDDPLDVHEDCPGKVLRVLGPVRTHGVGAQGAATRQIDATERTWDKDRPAYKRLRMEGMQPPHVDGAARLESVASNDLEVNTGLRYGKIPERQVKEAVTLARESGWIPKVSA